MGNTRKLRRARADVTTTLTRGDHEVLAISRREIQDLRDTVENLERRLGSEVATLQSADHTVLALCRREIDGQRHVCSTAFDAVTHTATAMVEDLRLVRRDLDGTLSRTVPRMLRLAYAATKRFRFTPAG